jgi:thiol-disulfide isomerase/thioredoxin
LKEVIMDVKLPPWRRRLSIALLVHLYLAVASVHAQPPFAGEGRVVAVDEANGAVTLDHGPIPGLMPAMRMTFPVPQGELLRGLQVGEVVRFSLEPRGPEWVIATMEKAGGRPPPRPVMFQGPDFTLPTLSGASLRLADLRGQVVLLNFWATWCVPCRTEMPTIEALYQRYKGRGLEVVAVNVDLLSTAGVEAFVKEVGVTFRVVLDPSWATARAYSVVGVPTTYLINRAGNVVVREVGERDWMDDVSQMAVEGLLQEPSTADQR